MSKRLSGRIAIITGSSSGLGRSIAVAYAAEGARVVCADLTPTPRLEKDGPAGAAATHEAIQQEHGKDSAVFIKTNAADENEVKAVVAEAVKWGGRLDIMVCNAGISTEVSRGNTFRIHDTPVEDFDKSHAVNSRGVWLGNKYAVEQMLKQDPQPPNYRGDAVRGWIINTASMLGLVGLACAPCYVPTKHMVVGITRQVALDYAKEKIHVNALCPGFIGTALIKDYLEVEGVQAGTEAAHPWGTMGNEQDVSRAAVFLASDDAGWMTGHPLVMDGGYTCQ